MLKRLPLLVPLLLLGLLAVDVGPASALAIHNVTTTADVVNGGDGVLSLREAVSAANSDGDDSLIVLASGALYELDLCGTPQEIGNATGDLNLSGGSAVTIDGNGSTVEQTCVGERVIQATTPLSVQEVTITGGDLAMENFNTGGGISASNVLNVTDSVITDNQAEQGGALSANDITILRSALTANRAIIGGAVLAVGASTVDITASSVTGNTASNVPGVHLSFDGAVTVTNSTFAANDATTFSAALGTELNVLGDLTLVHATIVGDTGGPAVQALDSLTAFGSVIDDGGAGTCSTFNQGPTTTQGHNVASDAQCDFDDPTDAQNVADPGLGALGDNGGAGSTFLPNADSLLVDMIPVADCNPLVTVDARGLSRPTGAGCEPGAVEREAARAVDLHIRNSSQATFGGNDVINLTGAGQSRLQSKARGQKATFFVRFQNDGDAVDSLEVRGPASGAGFTVRYFSGPTNITAAVVAGNHLLESVAPGGTRTIKVEVTVGQGPRNVTRNLLVKGTSVGDPTERDVVKASVKRT